MRVELSIMKPTTGSVLLMHCLNVRALPADIDHMGHVNNSVYLRWIEKAVHAHWKELATPREFGDLLWVAVRHEVDYRCPAFVDDLLHVETRIVGTRRARAWYDSAITLGERIIVEARSCWCCVDAKSRRLTRIPSETAARFLSEPNPSR